MATLTTKKVNELAAGDLLAAYSSATGERAQFSTPVAVVAVTRQSGSGDDGNYFVQLSNDGNTPHNFVARASDFVVASGPDLVAVPDVNGDTTAVATTAITGAGLLEHTNSVTTTSFPAGTVFVQVPAAGDMVASGSTVEIYVAA